MPLFHRVFSTFLGISTRFFFPLIYEVDDSGGTQLSKSTLHTTPASHSPVRTALTPLYGPFSEEESTAENARVPLLPFCAADDRANLISTLSLVLWFTTSMLPETNTSESYLEGFCTRIFGKRQLYSCILSSKRTCRRPSGFNSMAPEPVILVRSVQVCQNVYWDVFPSHTEVRGIKETCSARNFIPSSSTTCSYVSPRIGTNGFLTILSRSNMEMANAHT
mmetsp:Transcript_27413/g.76607  ORF Transcript_27413/g.76607 Transcript_27413/m.76607 type:complete len:221 (+) Transcript_27413:584-1246(+)